jgi:DNA-binding LacI/PurR family transcriptional regulator
VPEDVSVVGYDDMLLSRLSTPSLSTIRQDNLRAGQLLVASVLDTSGEDMPSLLPTELVIRESCGG